MKAQAYCIGTKNWKIYVLGLFLLVILSFQVSAASLFGTDSNLRIALTFNADGNDSVTNQAPNLNGGTLSATGKNSGSLYCDGSDYPTYNNTEDYLDGAEWGSFTLAYWVNVTDWTVSNQYGVTKFYDGSSRSWQSGLTNAGNFLGRVSTDTQNDNDGASSSSGAFSSNVWHHVILEWNSTSDEICQYYDGSKLPASCTAQAGSYVRDNNEKLTLCADTNSGTPSGYLTGKIDEVYLWNRTLTTAEKSNLASGNSSAFYTTTTPTNASTNASHEITLISRNPSDLLGQSAFQYPNFNFTYYYFNTSNITSPYRFNYTITRSVSTCVNWVNGTCNLANGTWTQKNASIILNNTNSSSNVTYTLDENDIFSFTSNYDFYTTGSYTNVTLEANDWHLETYQNVPTSKNMTLVFESPTNTTGLIRIYIANSSYTEGLNPQSDANVQEICSITAGTPYNHTHGTDLGHRLCYIPVVNGGFNGLKITENTTILTARISGTATIPTLTTSVRTGSARYTANNGATWSESTTQRGHLHIFHADDTINFQAFGNVSTGGSLNSTLTSDTYGITEVPPSNPTITNPVNTPNTNASINITWTSGGTGVLYNVSILNSDLTTNKTINTSTNLLYYNWEIYKEVNTYLGEYYVKVEAYNANGTTTDIELMNITRNARINITAYNYINGTQISSFTGWIYNQETTLNETANATGTQSIKDFLRGNNTIYVTHPDYVNITTYTLNSTNTTNNQQNLKFYLPPINIPAGYSPNVSTTCGSGYDSVLRFNTEDEINLTTLAQDVSYNLYFDIASEYNASHVYGNLSSVDNFSICLNSTFFPSWRILSGEIQYTSSGYVTRRYYIFNYTHISVNSTNITLYNLASVSQTSFTLAIQSNTLDKYVGKYTTLVRWYPANDAYRVVDMGLTDGTGSTVIHVVPEDVDYRIGVYETNGSLIYLASPIRMVCLTTPCSYTLTVPSTTTGYTNYLQVETRLDYNETTSMWTFTWSDPTQTTDTMNLTIYKETGTNVYPVCSSETTGYVGAITCNTSTYSGKLRAKVIRTASPGVVIASLAITTITTAFKSSLGLFLTFLIIIPVIFVFALISPLAGIIGGVISLIPAWYLGSISGLIITSLAVAGGIVIHFANRARGR